MSNQTLTISELLTNTTFKSLHRVRIGRRKVNYQVIQLKNIGFCNLPIKKTQMRANHLLLKIQMPAIRQLLEVV